MREREVLGPPVENFGKGRKINFLVLYPQYQKALELPKQTQQKQRRVQAQNCAHKSPFQLNFTKISSFIGPAAL
jgi:hypothetical protein